MMKTKTENKQVERKTHSIQFHALLMYDNRFTNVDYQQTVENLKVKLSLNKQVWSGMSNSVDTNNTDSNYQPLSWGISVVNKKKPFKLDTNEELFA